MPKVMERMKSVTEFRLGKIPARKAVEKDGEAEAKERGAGTIAMAATPTKFHVTVIPERPYLAIPEVSSERREYVPIGWLQPPTIPSNLIRIIDKADLWDFGLITSRMHMAWLRNIGGRLKSDYRYSIGIVYNAFPWPASDHELRAEVEKLAQGVLDARKAHAGSSLADIYDPQAMPDDLRRAHRFLDNAVDKVFRLQKFSSDRDRVEHLLMLYEILSAPVMAASGGKGTRRVSNKRRAG